MRFDLIIRNGSVVLDAGVERLSIGISEGKIAALEPQPPGDALEEIDASGLHVLPGVIDSHVHFNEPGRTEWEGFATGSAALAAGGGTCFFDMPLNSSPPVLDGASFDLKRAAAEQHAVTDFGLWGGLVPGSLDRLDELAHRGVVGFKAFMCNSGIDDFARADDATLYDGTARAAELGLPVAVHAENEEITAALARRARAAGRTGIRDYLDSRPVIAEVEAIRRAIVFASETGCSLHIVHISSGRGVAAVTEARSRGVDVTCETCPHHLVFTDEDMERIGAAAKCAPPLRRRADLDDLWKYVADGRIDLLASDHSPSPPYLKQADNFFDIWGGISGCQSLLPVMLAEGHLSRELPLIRIAELTARRPAARYGLKGKGMISVGADADLVLIDLNAAEVLHPENLFYRHAMSPYTGRRLHGFVRQTLVRGETVFSEGKPTGAKPGRFVRPEIGCEHGPFRYEPGKGSFGRET